MADTHGGTPTPTAVVTALTDAFNAGDYDAALAWIADDAVNHGPPPTRDLGEWRQAWIASKTAFPDMRADVEHIVEQGDTVCRRVRITGTNTGGDAPTGRAVDVVGMDMVRVVGGKVVEHWAFADAAAMAEQLSGRPTDSTNRPRSPNRLTMAGDPAGMTGLRSRRGGLGPDVSGRRGG